MKHLIKIGGVIALSLLTVFVFVPLVSAYEHEQTWRDAEEDFERIQSAKEDYETRKMIRRAEYLASDGQPGGAFVLLKEVKERLRDSKELVKVSKRIAKLEEKLLKQIEKKRRLFNQTEKKRRLAEVDNYWEAPTPFIKEPKVEEEVLEDTMESRSKQKIPLIDFKDATLKEVVRFLAIAAEVNIVIDEAALVSEDRVTVYLQEIPMIEALNYILKTKKLASQIEDNLILVTTPEALEGALEVRVYDVQDLIGKLHDFPSVPFNLAEISAGGGDVQ